MWVAWTHTNSGQSGAEEPGPPLEHRLRDDAITAFACEAGFQRVERLALAHTVLSRLNP